MRDGGHACPSWSKAATGRTAANWSMRRSRSCPASPQPLACLHPDGTSPTPAPNCPNPSYATARWPPPPGAQRRGCSTSPPWPGDCRLLSSTAMVWLVGRMLSDPKHFYRSYTTQELDRIMTARPASSTGVRAREMNLYRRYFDLVAAGRKTIEVRVQYPNLRNLKAGDHIRFVCGRDDALTRVKRVSPLRLVRGDARQRRRRQRQPRQSPRAATGQHPPHLRPREGGARRAGHRDRTPPVRHCVTDHHVTEPHPSGRGQGPRTARALRHPGVLASLTGGKCGSRWSLLPGSR